MDIKQLRELIIRPALQIIEKHSLAAENLLVGTAIIESNAGDFVKQVQGPALGIYQCEPATYKAITNWLLRMDNIRIRKSCLSACYLDILPPVEMLIYNLRWATIICRIHYYRFDEPLPNADDISGLARYYKKYYNTPKGASTVEKFEALYRKYADDTQGTTL